MTTVFIDVAANAYRLIAYCVYEVNSMAASDCNYMYIIEFKRILTAYVQ